MTIDARVGCYLSQLAPHIKGKEGPMLLNELLNEYRDLFVRNLKLEKVVSAAKGSVANKAWSGVCDEDVLLEDALIELGDIDD